MKTKLLLFGALALSGAVLSADFANANQFKRVRDVNVACNNAILCDLYITNPRVTLQTFGIRRAASRDADARIFLAMRDPLRAGTDVEFVIDGELVAAVPVSDFSYRAAVYEYIYGEKETVLELLKAARRGNQLQIRYTTKAGRSTAPFSLSGITAGMIFADEAQGRVNRDDALIAITGEQRTPTNTDAQYSESQFRTWGDLPSGLQNYFGTDSHVCSRTYGADSEEIFGAGSIAVNETTSIIYVPCHSPGAYNLPQAFFLKTDDVVRHIALPTMSSAGPTTTPYTWNIVWDDATRTLSSFFKGRGLGDCGTLTEWSLQDVDAEPTFVLTSQRVKDNCDGVYRDDFSDYTQVWPIS